MSRSPGISLDTRLIKTRRYQGLIIELRQGRQQQATMDHLIDKARGGGLVISFRGKIPDFGEDVFLAPNTQTIGDVKLGRSSSVWFNSVLRGDINRIEVGEFSNIQDNSVLHVGDHFPCIVGARVVVGHRAILHGCTVGDEVMIGMGAMVLNGAVIGSGSIIAAGALVTEGKVIPPNSLVMGTPGKVVRTVTPEQAAETIHLAEKYARVAREYLNPLL